MDEKVYETQWGELVIILGLVEDDQAIVEPLEGGKSWTENVRLLVLRDE